MFGIAAPIFVCIWAIRRYMASRWRRSLLASRAAATVPYKLGFTSATRFNSPPTLLEGAVPDWIEGTLIRGGPGAFESGEAAVKHWFDGLSMLNKFEISAGRVTYSRSFAAKGMHDYIAAHGDAPISFGEDPCHGLLGNLQSVFTMGASLRTPGINNVNVTFKRIAREWYNATDAALVQKVDVHTLKADDAVSLDKAFKEPRLAGNFSPAHGHYDVARAEFLNVVLDVKTSTYRVFVVPDAQAEPTRVLASVKGLRPAYLHSTACTSDYFVLMVWPAYINPLVMLASRSVMKAISWTGDHTQVVVIRRSDGAEVVRTMAPPFFCFHNINAVEKDGALLCDLIAYDDASVLNALYVDKLLAGGGFGPGGFVSRLTVPLDNSKTASLKMLSALPVELNRINPLYAMRDYRFVYAVAWPADAAPKDRVPSMIARVDVSTGQHLSWAEKNCFPGEPIFVPRPDASDEDDGVVLSIVLDANNKSSFLLVLDGKTLQEVARATCTDHIPFGFHGQFVSSSSPTDIN